MGTLAVVELPFRSGLPKDKVVNTFAFAEEASWRGTELGTAVYVDAITRFYTVADPTTAKTFGALASSAFSRVTNACAIKLYDISDHLDGSPHGSPYNVANFTLAASDTTSVLPEEVATCVTLEASNRQLQRVEVPDGSDAGTKPDRPRQRYTGRIYFGPWKFHADTINPDANGMSRPGAVLMATLGGLMHRLADNVAVNSTDKASLGIWSRANANIRGAANIRWDDAFDTQRRRGTSPTTVSRLAVAELVPEIELAS